MLALWVGLHGFHAIKIVLKRRDPIRSGVAFAGLMGLTAVLIHASAEFLLHIPAVTATLMVLMGMVINISGNGRTQPETPVTALTGHG